jgi:hypothetical protein
VIAVTGTMINSKPFLFSSMRVHPTHSLRDVAQAMKEQFSHNQAPFVAGLTGLSPKDSTAETIAKAVKKSGLTVLVPVAQRSTIVGRKVKLSGTAELWGTGDQPLTKDDLAPTDMFPSDHPILQIMCEVMNA